MVAKAKKAGAGFSLGLTQILAIALLVTFVLALASFVYLSRYERNIEQYVLDVADQRVLSHQIAKYAAEAGAGSEKAFGLLLESRDRFTLLLDELKFGSVEKDLPASPEVTKPDITRLENSWLELRSHVDAILANQEQILGIDEVRLVLRDTIPDLLDISSEVADTLVDSKAPQNQVYQSTRMLFLAQRINTSLSDLLAGGATTSLSSDQLSQDVDEIKTVINALIQGSKDLGLKAVKQQDAKEALLEAAAILIDMDEALVQIQEMLPDVLPALESLGETSIEQLAQEALAAGEVLPDMDVAGALISSSDRVNDVTAELIDLYGTSPGRLAIGPIQVSPALVVILGILGGGLLILLGLVLVTDARKRERVTAVQYQRNQEAIRRLLDEMGDLADGDLSVEATVTEDITGAIADSINYAIEAMREVVESINMTSENVSQSAQTNRATVMHLAEASEHQREQISGASQTIQHMTETMSTMANDASNSASVAQQSLEIAGKGGDAVRQTIRGMDNIREQIQETSKRIKRLGESSQEIGNIVELIEDIADQTNILALNAAMQAAMAGEAGRGFAVVADEVQRLAERSTNATKQIEALVQTIQADTNEAVSSMESSTSEVVSGAKIAEAAGESLQEIETVSKEISVITEKMASSAQATSGEAGRLNDTMGVIQEITQQTSEGTSNTAEAIGSLADNINDLRQSVSGFKLPEA
ncbi:MAG: methyl-accepting chemotaxis protein [bacterium]